jgi:Zn-dependent protease
VNVLVMIFNLLPVRGLDGAEAWTLFRWRNVRGVAKRTALEARKRQVEAELKKLGARGDGGSGSDDRSMMN